MSSREVIQPKSDKRDARRDPQGEFTGNQVSFGKSLAADQRSAKTVVSKGQANRGGPRKKS
jgi:hypothetical protein